MKNSAIIFLISFLVPSMFIFGQKVDNELWAGFEIKYELNKSMMLEFGQQARYEDDYSDFKKSLTDFGFVYEFTGNFKAKAIYRLETRNKKPQHSAILNLYAEEKLKEFTFQYRLRFHNTFDFEKDDDFNIRNKIKIEAKFKKFPLIPFVAGELYYRTFYEKGDRFNKYRLYGGIVFDLPEKQQIDLHFIYQKEFNVKKPELERIIGLFYSIKL